MPDGGPVCDALAYRCSYMTVRIVLVLLMLMLFIA